MAANIGYLFNKDYYREFDYEKIGDKKYTTDHFSKRNNAIKQPYTPEQSQPSDTANPFELKTVYPGLAIGLGYGHGVQAVGEFKLGFSFDYTTGLPVIPGSSIKGLLRSIFTAAVKHGKRDNSGEPDFLSGLFIKAGLSEEIARELDIKKLEKEIFDGVSIDSETSKDEQLSIYHRDIFHDAVIVSGNTAYRIFGDDSITPHKDPLRNPIPLLFMKVLPGVTFSFDIDAKDSKIEKEVTAEIKRNVFKEILKTFGIGAKTNVGYGRLIDP